MASIKKIICTIDSLTLLFSTATSNIAYGSLRSFRFFTCNCTEVPIINLPRWWHPAVCIETIVNRKGMNKRTNVETRRAL